MDQDADGSLNPVLATSWEQTSPNEWVFQLRKDVRFHNGEDLDSSAVADALNYLKALPTPPQSLEGVEFEATPDGPFTLNVSTAKPDPDFPRRLSDYQVQILAPEAYRSDPVLVKGFATGAFEVQSITPGESVVVTRFEDYWGKKANLDSVEALLMPDPASRVNALRAGDVDIAKDIPIPQVPVLRELEGLEVVSVPTRRVVEMTTNMSRPPLDDARVREAIELAVDRTALAEQVLGGEAMPASLIFGSVVPYGQDSPPPGADPERARELLQEAGFSPGELELQLWTYGSRPYLPPVATAVQEMLKQAGIDVKIRLGEYDALLPKVLDGDYDLWLIAREYGAGAATLLSTDYTCRGSLNMNNYCSKSFDSRVAELSEIFDADQRESAFRQAAEQLDREVVGVPLAHLTTAYGLSDSVSGFEADSLELDIITPELSIGDGGEE